jgi:erythromycin esterase
MVDWVRQAANPFLTPLAGHGLDDLSFVKSMVGEAKIVGLGEGTHGTSEFFRMKHRLMEYLATEMGFNIFAIEANMPEAYRLNDYVLYGRGNPKELLKGMYFWTWNTQEVLDMILWMREFNASGRGQLQFTGFDMQFTAVAIDNVRTFVQKADPAYLGTLDAAYTLAKSVGYNQTSGAEAAAEAARGIWQYLEQQRSGYLASFSAEEVDWAIQNGKIVEQATYVLVAGSSYRDACMAANFEWILQHSPPGSKAVIWAHNYHVSRTSGAMGSYLAANHDKDYLVVGQIFHEGTYNAVGSGRLGVNTATPSFAGSMEYVFHSTGIPQFVLDLRKASRVDPGSSWLLGEVEYRSIGAVATDGFFNIKQLPNYYDALVFFDQTTPSALLPF